MYVGIRLTPCPQRLIFFFPSPQSPIPILQIPQFIGKIRTKLLQLCIVDS